MYSSKSYIAYMLTALFLCYEMALQVSPSIVTHELMQAMHITAAGLGMMTAAYFWTYTCMQIPVGILIDHFGVRRLVTSALLLCATGIGLFAMVNSPIMGAVARLLMGFGSAFAFVSVLAVAEYCFPPYRFALLAGIAQLLAAIGAMGGQLPLALLVKHYSWRSVFLGLWGIGFVLAGLTWFILKDKHQSDIDVKSQAFTLLQGLKVVFKSSQSWFIALYAFLNWAPMVAFASLWGVPYLKAAYQLDNTKAASLCSLLWIGIGVGSPLIGYISDYIKRRCILLTFSAGLGLIAVLILLYIPHLPLMEVGILLFLIGISCSGQVLSFAVMKDNTLSAVRLTATAFNNMAIVASGIIFQPLIGALLKCHAKGDFIQGIPVYSIQDFQYSLIVLPIAYLVGCFLSIFCIKETYCQDQFSA